MSLTATLTSGFHHYKFMNINELLDMVRRRLGRKAKQAENAYVSEFTVKSTTNCLNHGIQLEENIWHCKINALGLHEQGASQCWNNKARICPVFELLRGVETLKRDFRKMGPNELAIRWPSIGELMRFEHLLSEVDEIKERSHEKADESGMCESRGQLPDSDASRVGPIDRDVREQFFDGCGNSSSQTTSGIDEDWRSDERGTEPGPGDKTGLPLESVERSRNRDHSDREKIRPK